MSDTTIAARRGWLIVEDEALIAMLVEDALEEIGVSVFGTARTVAEAMKLIETAEPHGAILDVNLAGEKVYPVATALEHRNVPFAFLTGQSELDVMEEFNSIPVVQKPFLPEQIQALVRQLVPAP